MVQGIWKEHIKLSLELTDVYRDLLEIIWLALEEKENVSQPMTERLIGLAVKLQEQVGTLELEYYEGGTDSRVDI